MEITLETSEGLFLLGLWQRAREREYESETSPVQGPQAAR